MTDPLDDALRDALGAEAGDAEAGPDLLTRVREARRPGPRRKLLAIAAAVGAIAVTAVGLVVADGGDDEALDVVDVPTVCPTDLTGQRACGDADADDHPRFLAYVREDGWLVTMDLSEGTHHELLTRGDPREGASIEEGSSFVSDVQLSGDWIYFSTCCEPTIGPVYRIRVTGGEPERVATGDHPAVSPDGRYLATAVESQVWLYDLRQLEALPAMGEEGLQPITMHDNCCPDGAFSWSPDGTRLAWMGFQGDSTATYHEAMFDGTRLEEVEAPFEPRTGTSTDRMLREPDGTLVRRDAAPEARGVSQDPTCRWNLWIDSSSTLLFQHGADGDRRPISGVPKVIAADW